MRPNSSRSFKPLKIKILVRKTSEIFSVHACCTEELFSLAHFRSRVNGVWKVLNFVTLNKQQSATKSPDKKSAPWARRGACQLFVQGARRFFAAASLKFDKVGQNFVKAKHAGCTRLQHSLAVFFCKVNKTSA